MLVMPKLSTGRAFLPPVPCGPVPPFFASLIVTSVAPCACTSLISLSSAAASLGRGRTAADLSARPRASVEISR